MSAITLKAHFDGAHIVLDEPYALPANAELVVTVLPESPSDDFDENLWSHALASNDAFDFLADPAEDIYTLNDGEPFKDAL